MICMGSDLQIVYDRRKEQDKVPLCRDQVAQQRDLFLLSSPQERQNCDTLLFEAARQGLTHGIIKAVRLGARVQWRNPASDGRTALHVAAGGGHTESVKLLLTLGADLDATNLYREVALHESAVGGRYSTTVQLVGYGADPNCVNKYSSTPLHCAASEGHLMASLVLLCCGANASLINAYGKNELLAPHNVLPHTRNFCNADIATRQACRQQTSPNCEDTRDCTRAYSTLRSLPRSRLQSSR